MNKIIFKLFGKMILSKIIEYFDKPEVKGKYIALINAKIDLPGKNEEEEKRLFTDITDVSFAQIKTLLKDVK
jgi:hypothetical protein